MVKVFGHYVARDTLVLIVGEWLLFACCVYAAEAAIAAHSALYYGLNSRLIETVLLTTATFAMSGVALGIYDPGAGYANFNFVLRIVVAAGGAVPIIWLILHIASLRYGNDTGNVLGTTELIEITLAWITSVLLTRTIYTFARRSKILVRRIAVVGSPHEITKFVRQVTLELENDHRLEIARDVAIGAQNSDQFVDDLNPADLKRAGITNLLLLQSNMDNPVLAQAVLRCKLAGLRILDEHRFWETERRRVDIGTLTVDRLCFESGFSSSEFNSFVKRLGDFIIAFFALIFTIPLMCIIAILVKWNSPGPIFYRQERVGLCGRVFTLIKFRSMYQNAEANTGPQWAAEKDDRVTSVGRFIRYTRMDELPQLLNVLRGEMTIVGPRPERPHFVKQLAIAIPFYSERHAVRPGITGWAQINYPYGASVEDAKAKLTYDLYYLKHRSLFLDLLIILSTFRVLLFQQGAR